jgi:hypothetical protein
MDEGRIEKHQGSSLTVFVLGILIGVALTLLFTTKKGRKILRALTDEGMDKISKWEDVLHKVQPQEEEDVDEIMDGEDYVATEPQDLPVEKGPETLTVKEKPVVANEAPTHSSVRRFFKRGKK